MDVRDLIQAAIRFLVERMGQSIRSDPSVILPIVAEHGKLQLETVATKLMHM